MGSFLTFILYYIMEEVKEKKSTKVEIKKAPVVKDTWEYKDRNYYLTNGKSPLTFTIPARHTRRYPLVWFDPEKGYERELRYATNQKSIFVDEQEGPATLKHVVFEDGTLSVPASKRNLQEFLAVHPFNNILFKELDHQANAVNELEHLELEMQAMNAASSIDIDQAEDEKSKAISAAAAQNIDNTPQIDALNKQIYDTNENIVEKKRQRVDLKSEVETLTKEFWSIPAEEEERRTRIIRGT